VDLSQWREQRAESGDLVLDLNGLEVHFRRLGVLDLAESGEIPTPLAALVQELIDGGSMKVKLDDFGKYAEVVNLVIKKAAVSPPVADEPGEGVLGVKEIPMVDRASVFSRLNGGTKLRPFRAE